MALNPQQVRVAELAAAGCSPKEIHRATGYSVSYISQLANNGLYVDLVTQLTAVRTEDSISRADSYDSLENSLLQEMETKLAFAEPVELARMLDTVAKHNPRRQRSMNGMGGGTEGSNAVTLILPLHVVQPMALEHNARNEIITVNEEPMASLTEKNFRAKLAHE